jgi:transcriptional regulator of acetoin/glycerol metabolism
VENNPVTLVPAQGTFSDSTRAVILHALQATGWVIGGPDGAAARLGLKRTTLIAKMKKLGISRPDPISYASQFVEDESSGFAM